MLPIGIFGGTFDPIHLGHLRTALELLHSPGLQEVRFVPCRIPPHRQMPVAPADLRLRMICAAVAGQAGFMVDERELQRDGPSYSVVTLESLRSDHPDLPLALIVGMDAFLGLTTWHRWPELLELGHLIVVHRPGWTPPESGELGGLLARCGAREATDLSQWAAGRILVQPVTQLDISASEIRDRVRRGEDPRFLVTAEVRQIIIESGCYARAQTDFQEQEEKRPGA